MTSWWKVQRGDDEFMVLVVEGRVAAYTSALAGIQVGALWKDVRKRLTPVGFVFTMESPP